MMTDSICHLRPISEHQFKFQLYSEFVWCSCRCRNAAYSFCVPPVTTILVGKWQFSSAELPQRNSRQQCRSIFFLTKSKHSTGSIFMERLRDSSCWRACTYLAHFNIRSCCLKCRSSNTQMYLQPHYSNGFFGNVYFSSGQH